jgi:hypothetical protein
MVVNFCTGFYDIAGSKHKCTARNELREKALLPYMQKKYKWTDITIQGIDWAGHKPSGQFLDIRTPPRKPAQVTINVPPQFPARMAHNRKNGGKK